MSAEQFERVRVLPLWKAVVSEMLASDVKHGDVIDADFFEKGLSLSRDSMEFSLEVSKIRRALEAHGFYLSGQGGKGDSFTILPPEKNAQVMKSYAAQAADALRRGVILGTNTRLDLLSPDDRRRHEATLEKIALRSVLLSRAGKISKVIGKQNPSLLTR